MDILIPGDDLFPKASAVGAHYWLLDKLRETFGSEGVDAVIAALTADRTFLADLAMEQQVEIARRFEQDKPELFVFVRAATYFGYYQSPLVVRAIRQLGHDYNDAPQPNGYVLPPFDPLQNLPKQPRGYYKPTNEITRVNLSGIDIEER